ncbi:E3 ubiquitin-protein ligase CCNB1IP1 [Acipenser ruthenus]|uniref:E3 ubiquitin-protein ligase CCNB1IP1 n=1 Tax=Acipenser ruthenus TaxID=7906 RepID=UPI001561800B|nr:E3 ubiquitin-protein ligase CCNB1IP1 [Acipenser ruthenus]
MALYEDTLLCNFPKCRAKLSGFAWVTACSHIFCDPHGSGEFSRSPAVCPACSSALSGKLDIVRSELSPPEEYKAMVLAGLRPEIVLEISSRALAFWTYQVQQERLHQQYSLSRLEEQLKQTELLCSQRLQGKECEVSGVKGELSALSKLLEEYKRKYSDVSEKLMERNRQHHKLQGLYDSLRLRNMAASSQERERESRERERGSHNYIFSRAVGQPKFHTPQGSRSHCGEGDHKNRHALFYSPPPGGTVPTAAASGFEAEKEGFFQFPSPAREGPHSYYMQKQ